MPRQGRLGDKANVALDVHGCPACPHPAIGPAIQGSPDVNVNRRPALRVDDPGIHSACCGKNTWTATKGSLTVFINGRGAHRMGDETRHCGGIGQLVEGSPNVMVGESTNVVAVALRQASATEIDRKVSASAATESLNGGTSSNDGGSSPGSGGSPGRPLPSDTGAPGSGTPPDREGTPASTPSSSPDASTDPTAASASMPPDAEHSDAPEPGIDLDPAALRVQAQADVLRAAASAHIPFCEQCENKSRR